MWSRQTINLTNEEDVAVPGTTTDKPLDRAPNAGKMRWKQTKSNMTETIARPYKSLCGQVDDDKDMNVLP